MGSFLLSSSFDADVEKATSGTSTTEDWALIMEICDKVGASSVNSKDCLKSIIKRLYNQDPHVVLQAITLFDACVNNCGKNFLLEVASRHFEQEYRKLLAKNLPQKVADRLKSLLKKWAENEFKNDPQLNLIPSLYTKLKQEGVDFSLTPDVNHSKSGKSKDLVSLQEVDDIAKAIELSLLENERSAQKKPTGETDRRSYLKKVKALYDFEAAEDNELSFSAGNIIYVLDSSDPNWWKGFTDKHPEGLFPANFVTTDLSSPKDISEEVNTKKSKVKHSAEDFKSVEIDENKIDSLLQLLREANPEDDSTDTEEMSILEAQANAMGPMIEAQLEQLDKKHSQLTQLCTELLEAVKLYNIFMKEPVVGYASKPQTEPIQPPTMSPQHMMHPQHMQMYNGMMANYAPLPVEHYMPGSQYPVNPSHMMSRPNIGGQIHEQPSYQIPNMQNIPNYNQVYGPGQTAPSESLPQVMNYVPQPQPPPQQ
ncbi:signal transducing adapter molecule 1 [Rhopalosiphum maidis]|uniref:signal transducing adapter molecule 1 n=1 Tax=Rhopalosiphum maidis TaxID=43146 RepID=UPI000EFFBCF8|nr:signal transducing adapter molecule 1 [Rhopalosiphum maidis]